MIRFAVSFIALSLVAAEPAHDQSRAIEAALKRSGTNRVEIEKALRDAPIEQRPGIEFLVANMPDSDLTSLKAAFLLDNLQLAYKARKELPWGKAIPDDVFLNNVLPYANVNESRDPWRRELYELSLPIVKECKTPSEVAEKLNRTLFEKLNVKYSTKRKKPDQSPLESMSTGKASCTGLSILLSDACRSVCVPTRIVGTPLWSNKRGNHTWVEIWDRRWRFTGACEPDPNGLDRGWFVGEAAEAKKDSREHAIYAASFKRTGTTFPLVWAPQRKDVFAENVTDRYAAKAAPKPDASRIAIRVWLPGKKERTSVPVRIVEVGTEKATPQKGVSRDDTADLHDVLTFDVNPGREYSITVGKPARGERKIMAEAGKELLIEIELPETK